MGFEELYRIALKDALNGRETAAENERHLDCLLFPEKYAAVIRTEECGDCGREKPCVKSCVFDALSIAADGTVVIDPTACNGCLACVEACKEGKIAASRDTVAAIKAVRNPDRLAYALIAPAFLGQFSADVTPGKLRSALRALGFDGMLEVALFADVLTLKEALEFNKNVRTEKDFQLTSCCCPVWIAMLRKIYAELVPHIPASVSPMIAAGRVVKLLHPDAVTVFIGPCVAKKSEAREADVAGAVDYVLTFQEAAELFRLSQIDPAVMEDNEKDHSSRAGRIYARAGGVAEAVKATVETLSPDRKVPFRAKTADGVPACREMLEALKEGRGNANFYEGMGCRGGCVGGPKTMIACATATENVERYGADATYATPVDNPYVTELLARLNVKTLEELLSENDIFSRHFL